MSESGKPPRVWLLEVEDYGGLFSSTMHPHSIHATEQSAQVEAAKQGKQPTRITAYWVQP